MLFKKRKKRKSVVNSRDMATKTVRKADKGRCPLCLAEEYVKHVLLQRKETKHWREKLIHDKWLSMNNEVSYRKLMKITNRTHIQNLQKNI
jgi:hypothetical protein